MFVNIKDQISFSENSRDLIVVAPSKMPTKETYVRRPVLRPNDPQNCCDKGAPLKHNEINRLRIKAVKEIKKNLGRDETAFLNSPSTMPRQASPTVARTTNLTRLIGSKLNAGDIAKLMRGPIIKSKEEILCLVCTEVMRLC